ncbi:MAG: hypothetical protein IJX45_05900 [Spirochaetaceae bacterium]|nr:hypothetical protein [Spirochaetaceae bacterium]MBQ8561100.1 hypothetical protein [Spirochaetaceae bacterium]
MESPQNRKSPWTEKHKRIELTTVMEHNAEYAQNIADEQNKNRRAYRESW